MSGPNRLSNITSRTLPDTASLDTARPNKPSSGVRQTTSPGFVPGHENLASLQRLDNASSNHRLGASKLPNTAAAHPASSFGGIGKGLERAIALDKNAQATGQSAVNGNHAKANDASVPARLRLPNDEAFPQGDIDKPLKPVPKHELAKYRDPQSLPPPRLGRSGVYHYGSVAVPFNMTLDYEKARKYLASQPNGRALLAAVETRGVPVVLEGAHMDASAMPRDQAQGLTIGIKWDPRMASASTAGGRVPPAEILAHEMGHSLRFFPDAHGNYFPNALSYKPIPSSGMAHERNVIRSSEAAIAVEHGRDAIRDDHEGAAYEVLDVAGTVARYPEDEKAIEKAKRNLRALTAEIDRRDLDPESVSEADIAQANSQMRGAEVLQSRLMSPAQLVAARQGILANVRSDLTKNAKARADLSGASPNPTDKGETPTGERFPSFPPVGSDKASDHLLKREAELVENMATSGGRQFPATFPPAGSDEAINTLLEEEKRLRRPASSR